MKTHAYLNFGGNCAEAFKFYEQHLGGKVSMLMTFGQSPDQSNVRSEDRDGVLYAQIELGGTHIKASDVPADRFQPIRSVYLTLEVSSDAEAERIYALLTEGGEIYMPMQETFFATRFGQFRDKFGVSWMVIHERPMP
ncbi:MAG TPA: VOC family protein [Terracidiphilus sp.]|nr:VOC family protein [Terracidiphilus sp.]